MIAVTIVPGQLGTLEGEAGEQLWCVTVPVDPIPQIVDADVHDVERRRPLDGGMTCDVWLTTPDVACRVPLAEWIHDVVCEERQVALLLTLGGVPQGFYLCQW